MLDPSNASLLALRNAAQSYLDQRQFDSAAPVLQEIIRNDPSDHRALMVLAKIHAMQGKMTEAGTYCMLAIRAAPSRMDYKERLLWWCGARPAEKYEELAEHAIVACLESADSLDCTMMRMLWSTHLLSRPDFYAAWGHAIWRMDNFDPAENKKFFEKITDFTPLLRPCFLLGIKNIAIHSLAFEEFMEHARRQILLNDDARKTISPRDRVALAVALAHYGFLTDYILSCTEDEREKVALLRSRISDSPDADADAESLALFACYEPLYRLKNRAALAERFAASEEIGELIKKQILDWEELQQAARGVMTLTGIDDDVSKQVREQYETFPYPRWTAFSKELLLRGWKMTGRNEEIEGPLRDGTPKILIAGCGTGKEVAMYATIFPNAEILAVDLSRASLAYAARKTAELGLGNVTLRQADILHLGGLGLDQTFDYVMSVGVLHHMKDPVAGWQILSGLLKPGGLMRIGLYSRIARRALWAARDLIIRDGYSNDAEGMRLFRKNSPRLLGNSILQNITGLGDYYYLSMYRDLLFHVHEHEYAIPEIAAILAELRLDFLSFYHPAVLASYEKEYPGAGDASKTDLANWHRLEEKNPDLFRDMYIFWCRKGSAGK